jgi:hypothetical protein
MDIKRIETYSLFEFCQAVEQAINEGWAFDLESNENTPIAYGSMLVAGMVKKVNKTKEKPLDITANNIADNTPVVNQEDNQVKRGRKPKDNT